jgi:hypothetical protein
MREIKRVNENVKICLLTALSELSEYAMNIKKICPTLNRNSIIKKPIENTTLLKQLTQMLNKNN